MRPLPPASELHDSHIIPEFQYATLYDTKHRFHVVSTNSAKRDRYGQKGFREKLLCSACETTFSKWEGYAKKSVEIHVGSSPTPPIFTLGLLSHEQSAKQTQANKSAGTLMAR